MGTPLSCIVIDDEPVALKIASSLVEETSFLKLIGSYQNSIEGVNAILEHEPDIIFLDIQMPEITGFDIIKSLKKKPEIILITSKKEYSIEAFEFNVTDYLLKPIKSYSRFLQAAQKAKDNIALLNKKETNDKDSIFLKVDSVLKKTNFTDILFIEAFGDYVKVHTKDKLQVIYSKLRAIESEFPSSQFIRVHRSFIVRIDKVESIDQNSLQIGNKIIPVSVRNKNNLLERIKTL
jgi:DNA-binding LytR/AlgR family response regulator